MKLSRICLVLLLTALIGAAPARADVMDEATRLESAWQEVLLDAYGERFNAADWQAAVQASQAFPRHLNDPAARELWFRDQALAIDPHNPQAVASLASSALARLQQIYSLEMLTAVLAGHAPEAMQWRALIQLPRHASAVEGALALQHFASQPSQNEQLAQMLAREYLSWQSTRIREKLDQLQRLRDEGRATPVVVAARAAEIVQLGTFSPELLALAKAPTVAPPSLVAGADFATWRADVESHLPNVLSPAEVTRRERLLLKLMSLVPKEYRAGVRDGQVVVPLEYREAQTFIVQAEQLANELTPVWRTAKPEAYARNRTILRDQLDTAESLITRKAPLEELEAALKQTTKLLEGDFGLSLLRSGSKADVVAESALDIRTSLKSSLAAARAGRWAEAESLRLDAYATFDNEIERRVLPRDATLGRQAERVFLDGGSSGLGIKTALDRRARGAELEAPYTQALASLDACVALLQVGLSPATVTFTTVTIVAREGLEAVVILAALLAGLRGAAGASSRRSIWIGVSLSIFATALTFWLARTIVQSLLRYGEKLEAVISVLAVFILLLVTNWVFHKYYWVGWNAKLRNLRRAASGRERWEGLAMVGVGFLTIYREGFETTLFLQSLILEGGMQPVLIGFAFGLAIMSLIGGAVFFIGAKLPYRQLLVVTGVLVVGILMTFVGSTVRLFQTVGWCPIHPIEGLDLPSWMGVWLGLYPSWEGMIIPFVGLGAVAAAWLWTKWQSRHAPGEAEENPAQTLAA